MIKKYLFGQLNLPSVAFMRDSNAGNAFLKLIRLMEDCMQDLELQLKIIKIMQNLGGNSNEKY
jgi:hypothetical protein